MVQWTVLQLCQDSGVVGRGGPEVNDRIPLLDVEMVVLLAGVGGRGGWGFGPAFEILETHYARQTR